MDKNAKTAEHVDLVEVDWASGAQRRLVMVSLDQHGRFAVAHTDKPDYWKSFLTRPIRGKGSATIDPKTAPRRYLEELHVAYGGSYFYATPLHQARVCLFTHASVQRLPSG